MNNIWIVIINGIVDNRVLWDGNTETWQPPAGVTMVREADLPRSYDIGESYP